MSNNNPIFVPNTSSLSKIGTKILEEPLLFLVNNYFYDIKQGILFSYQLFHRIENRINKIEKNKNIEYIFLKHILGILLRNEIIVQHVFCSILTL